MLRIKLIKIGNKKTSMFNIISSDSRKKITKKSVKLGFLDRIKKKLFIYKIKLFNEIKKGTGFSYGFIKTMRALNKKSFLEKYEIKIL
ncbi:hypothetical protein ACWNX6_00320 [Candidatus Vidania fulgoroideorum]